MNKKLMLYEYPDKYIKKYMYYYIRKQRSAIAKKHKSVRNQSEMNRTPQERQWELVSRGSERKRTAPDSAAAGRDVPGQRGRNGPGDFAPSPPPRVCAELNQKSPRTGNRTYYVSEENFFTLIFSLFPCSCSKCWFSLFLFKCYFTVKTFELTNFLKTETTEIPVSQLLYENNKIK